MVDPYLQIRGRGRHPDSEIRGVLVSKKIFWPFAPHFGLKIRGGGEGPPGPSPGSATAFNPLSPNRDQDQFSPYNIHMLPREMVMRVNKMITYEKML